MGVPTSEVGYTHAMPRREDHEVYKGHVVVLEKKLKEKCNIVHKIANTFREEIETVYN